MSSKQIIAVLGATGLQGGSVVKSLLADGTFDVRAVTRNTESQKAKDLRAAGATIVFADLEDLNSLERAFEGVWGVFGVTVWTLFPTHEYDQKATQEHEERHGRNLVDAAIATGVKHFLWSTLDGTPKPYCFHFESKKTIDDYLKSKLVPRTSLYTSLFFENVIRAGYLKRDESNKGFILDMRSPRDTPLPSYMAGETGAWALEAFKNPDEWIGKDMHLFAQSLTVDEYAAVISKVSGGLPVKVEAVSRDELLSMHPPENKIHNEMWLSKKLITEGYCVRDEALGKKGNPRASSFEQFARNDPELNALLTSLSRV